MSQETSWEFFFTGKRPGVKNTFVIKTFLPFLEFLFLQLSYPSGFNK